jgi:hypothetical protein
MISPVLAAPHSVCGAAVEGWTCCAPEEYLACAAVFLESRTGVRAVGAPPAELVEVVNPMQVSLRPPTIAVSLPVGCEAPLRSRRVELVALIGPEDAQIEDLWECGGVMEASVVRWVRGGNTHILVVLEVTMARCMPEAALRERPGG